jgi:hypothetical protein
MRSLVPSVMSSILVRDIQTDCFLNLTAEALSDRDLLTSLKILWSGNLEIKLNSDGKPNNYEFEIPHISDISVIYIIFHRQLSNSRCQVLPRSFNLKKLYFLTGAALKGPRSQCKGRCAETKRGKKICGKIGRVFSGFHCFIVMKSGRKTTAVIVG